MDKNDSLSRRILNPTESNVNAGNSEGIKKKLYNKILNDGLQVTEGKYNYADDFFIGAINEK